MRPTHSALARLACLTLAGIIAVGCTEPTDLVPIHNITIAPQNDSIEVGQTFGNWLITIADAGGNAISGRRVTWESSNVSVATIDQNTGVLTGIGQGATVVTARSGGKLATANIKVIPPILSIVVTPDSFDLPLTTTRAINPSLVGPDGIAITNRTINWSSANPGVAVVNANGVVTAIGLGTTTITIRAGTKQTTVRVRVIGEPVASVRITPVQPVQIVRLGQTRQLGAECLNASQQVLAGRSISWNSGNPLVATVTQNGLVSGVALGAATITATCDNSVNGSTQVTVTQVPVASVTISPTSLTLVTNSAGQLTATARDSAGNTLSLQGRQVDWQSNNIPVATVSNQGVVFGSSPGSANISVTVDGVSSTPVPVTVTMMLASRTRRLDGQSAFTRPND